MDALSPRVALLAIILSALGANYRTSNFIVTAPTPQLAREVGDAAELYRLELAREWLGHDLVPWHQPCPITVNVGSGLGAGGATSFMFDHRPHRSASGGRGQPAGRPYGWQMSIQGSRERVLDSVLPHEVTHTIFATHFGRPLPRWADEGACTTVEHASERQKQEQWLYRFLTTGRGIPFNRMFAMTEYPADILPLYSQGFSLARYLIASGGKQKFVRYVGDGLASNDWPAATQKHYGFQNLSELQLTWLDWVRQGYPPIRSVADDDSRVVLASTATDGTRHQQRTSSPGQVWSAVDTNPVPLVKSDALVARTDSAKSSSATSAGWDSWYARQRPSSQNAEARSSSRGEDVRSTSRPQPLENARQMVLEWGGPTPRTPALRR
jgi:hypothetical protein